MAGRITEEQRDEVLRLHAEGLTRNDIVCHTDLDDTPPCTHLWHHVRGAIVANATRSTEAAVSSRS